MTNLLVLHGATVAVATSALWNTGLIGQLVEIFLNQPPTALMALFVLLLMLVHFIVAFTATHLAEKEDQEDPEESEPSSKRRMTWIPEAPERNLGMEPDMFDPTDYPLAAIARANDDKESFLALYPCLKDSLLQSMEDSDMPPEAVEWAREALDYTVLGGKCNRGITVVTVHRALTRAQQGRNLTLIEVARAGVLGWAIEFLQAFFLVADDIMDDSQTRRGQPCWYKVPKVGMIAINDSFLLESFVFSLLRQHFGHEDYYSDLMDLFVRVTQKTVFGQLLDTTLAASVHEGAVDFSRYNMDTYSTIVNYKTAFYTFYLPVAIGMITSGVKDEASFTLAKNICCQMGHYFQVQDDFLDCYGDVETIGKVGTDIQDNKCSWLVVQALELANPAQLKILKENYGEDNPKKIDKVKELFKTLKLEKVFRDFEEQSYKEIQQELDKLKLIPRDVFEILLKKIYKRDK